MDEAQQVPAEAAQASNAAHKSEEGDASVVASATATEVELPDGNASENAGPSSSAAELVEEEEEEDPLVVAQREQKEQEQALAEAADIKAYDDPTIKVSTKKMICFPPRLSRLS